MAANEIKTWLWEARRAVITTLDFPKTWWLRSQGEASTWAAAFFLTATRARLGGPDTGLSISAAWTTNEERRRVVASLWADREPFLRLNEVLVDFSVHDWNSNVFQATGESEVFALHGVGDEMTADHDYSWDFFKLLAVPSPLRLFFARVGTIARTDLVVNRVGELERSLGDLVARYGERLLGAGDEVAVVLLAATKEAARSTRVLHLAEGRLVGTGIGEADYFPPLWKRDL